MRWMSWLVVGLAIPTFAAFGCRDTEGKKGFFSRDGNCTDGSTPDCTNRCECKTLGRCKHEGKKCVEVSDEACKASEVCATDGSCSFIKGKCAPGSDADCAQSKFCKIANTCVLGGDRCVKPPAAPSSSPLTPPPH